MYLFNIQNKDDIYNSVQQDLRSKGIKHARVKKSNTKQVDKNAVKSSTFKRPIESLTTTTVEVNCGSFIEIPLILWQICDYIRQHVETEGLFRKAGSAARQKEIRKIIEKEGQLIDYEKHHVIDIANILKLFLRELPEPLLPYQFHDTFLRCLLLKTNQLESLLLVCLLMPSRSLSTLTFLMEFLYNVAAHSEHNLMDVFNLAIIFTPSIMPVGEKLGLQAGTRLNHHVKVVEHLINNFHKIGFLPNSLTSWSTISSDPTEVDKEESNKSNKKKKKRRSGSLTRMFSGLKKMVTKTTSDQDEDCLITNDATIPTATPVIKSTKKRKNDQEIAQPKKKRDFLQGFPTGLSFGSPMIFTPPCTLNPVHGSASSIVFSNPNPSTSVKLSPNRSKRRFFNVKNTNERELTKSAKVKSRRSVTSLITSKKSARKSFDLPDTYTTEKNSGKKHSDSFSPVLLSSSTLSISELSESDHIVNLSDQSNNLDEFVRIPKREYEEIKERVSLIESHITELTTREDEKGNNSAMNRNLVQSVYEQTLEESRPLDDPGTEKLARKLSRELRIRRSQSNRIIRSPSARRIGTIRRRSRESARNLASMTNLHQTATNQTNEQFYPRISLRRGQPNTVYSGLRPPSTPGRSLDNALYDDEHTPKIIRASSFHGSENTHKQERLSSNVTEIITPNIYQNNYDSNWQNAEAYFTEKMATSEEAIPPTGRASIVRLRNQNAGLVLQRMKLFDSQNPTPKLIHSRSGQLRKEAIRQSLRLLNRDKKIKTNSQSGKENLISPNNANKNNNNINLKFDDISLTKLNNNSLIKTPSPIVIPLYNIKTRGNSISPLKDNNRIESDIQTPIIGPSIVNNGKSSRREMPLIKRPLVTGKTPQHLLSTELVRRSSPRRRDIGPFKALPISLDSANTTSPRRSPRPLKSRNLTRVLN